MFVTTAEHGLKAVGMDCGSPRVQGKVVLRKKEVDAWMRDSPVETFVKEGLYQKACGALVQEPP
eukprot:6205642-Karenia_brevis.AAC.1